MKTYQDLLRTGSGERMDFVYGLIREHQGSALYAQARLGDDYNRRRNTTILRYQRTLRTLSGRIIPDRWSPDHKLTSAFFQRFVAQEVQYLLGNGVTWQKPDTAARLGKGFDSVLQRLGEQALTGGCAFGFWNLDHLEGFSLLEFAPLYHEETGALSAGVRFWQLSPEKPLRATLYEPEGYTEYLWEDGQGRILRDRQPYKVIARFTPAGGEEEVRSENYPGFPIVPLWGNPQHQSELVGLQEQIDAYDLIKSGFAGDLDNAQVYWILHNTGGMDDVDLAEFLERLHTVRAAAVDTDAGAGVESHTVEIPSQAREMLLDRLSRDLYRDAMALDTEALAAGAVTATQIRAAYEPLNSKTDRFEYCVLDFLLAILSLAGIEDTPTFTRSAMLNIQEDVSTILSAADCLDREYVKNKILTLLGDGDQGKA